MTAGRIDRPVRPAEQDARRHVGELPRYREGEELLGEAVFTGRVGDTRVLTVVPRTWSLSMFSLCNPEPNPGLELSTEINGHAFNRTSCGVGTRGGAGHERQSWQALGVRLGQPMTARITVLKAPPGTGVVDVPAVPGARSVVRVGIYAAVPVQDYPFPARPAVVPRPEGAGVVNLVTLRSQRRVTLASPNGVWEQTMPYHRDLVAHVVTTAPGLVRIVVQGRLVAPAATWDYHQSEFPVPLDPPALFDAGATPPREGAPVTVRVEVSRFAATDWDVRIGRTAT